MWPACIHIVAISRNSAAPSPPPLATCRLRLWCVALHWDPPYLRTVAAHSRSLGRDIAIKELLPGRDDVRFEREARITARLAHPAIVAIHEAGRWPSGEPFFAMKLVAGTSLDKRLAATTSFAERLA